MIQNIRRSLTDLLGAEYTAAVGGAGAGPPRPTPPPQGAAGPRHSQAKAPKLCAPWPMRRSIFIPRLLPAARRS